MNNAFVRNYELESDYDTLIESTLELDPSKPGSVSIEAQVLNNIARDVFAITPQSPELILNGGTELETGQFKDWAQAAHDYLENSGMSREEAASVVMAPVNVSRSTNNWLEQNYGSDIEKRYDRILLEALGGFDDFDEDYRKDVEDSYD